MAEIDYENLTHRAMLNLISEVLRLVSEKGLPGGHHFYISFKTEAAGVGISDSLKEQYPAEMTIVLQNQFENLIVSDDGFSVRLSFNHTPHDLYIPFQALTKFYDPSVSFGLVLEDMQVDPQLPDAQLSGAPAEQDADVIFEDPDMKAGVVVSLETFRNKKD